MNPLEAESRPSPSERVLVLVQGARDGEITRNLLVRNGFEAVLCRDMNELRSEIEAGAGAALLAEEVLTLEARAQLSHILHNQPPWSDFPIMIFRDAKQSAHRGGGDSACDLGNVTFLERPVHVRSMLAAVHAALRSRVRQYEARHAIEARDAFLAMLGHELRNPLAAVRLAVESLDRTAPEFGGARELSIIDRQSRHLTRLVDDLLDVARITRGKIVLEREKLNLVEVVQNAFETQEARAHEHQLSYSLRAHEPQIWVYGDRQRLEQVFANLLTNAIKYTSSGGAVVVDVRAEGDRAVVSVTDTGVGIAADMLERIFGAFAQIDHSLDRSQGGIGLGLSVVRGLVKLHDGSVEASSPGPGLGSTFHVRLVRYFEPVGAASGANSSNVRGMSPKRVVIVDDNADIRELLATLLSTAGHNVICAGDGPEGLERILTLAPDVAFVDLSLPGFDGFELARRARARGSTVHLVAVSGYGRADDQRRSGDAGFDAHLMKPMLMSDIEHVMLRAERCKELVYAYEASADSC